jgi:transposase
MLDLSHGLSNSKLEDSKIRLINHRGYGHHTAAVIAMTYLSCSGLTIALPTGRRRTRKPPW